MQQHPGKTQAPEPVSHGIEEVFVRCHREQRKAFIPFLMAGDPDLETTPQLLEALVTGGADVIGLGVPFSDPIADGPTIQRSANRALGSGTTMSAVLDLVAQNRERIRVPMVLFTYYNPVHVRGVEAFAQQVASSGIDGVLCVDLPPEEAEVELIPALRERRLDSIFLLSPTSTRARVKKVSEASTGFVYYVSRTGVTGEREVLPRELVQDVKRLRKRLRLPVAVGFGISTPDQVSAVAKIADAVVVGSALVQEVEDNVGQEDLASRVEGKARELSSPLRKSTK